MLIFSEVSSNMINHEIFIFKQIYFLDKPLLNRFSQEQYLKIKFYTDISQLINQAWFRACSLATTKLFWFHINAHTCLTWDMTQTNKDLSQVEYDEKCWLMTRPT